MPGRTATITQVASGSIAAGTLVTVRGVVATSPKFLASQGSKGACSWGLFISEPIAQAVPYSGALVLTSGARAVATAAGAFGPCPAGTDFIPSDTAAGDVFDVTATVISYVRADCATTTTPPPVPELRLSNACAVTRTARGGKVPAPAALAAVSDLTNTASDAIHRKWTGVLVELDGVTGVDVNAQGPVGATGSIQLTNGVRVRDRIYQGRQTALFHPAITWSRIVGLSHLDVCAWSVEPRDTCTDFTPKSQGCP
jgi:hypothetical protein